MDGQMKGIVGAVPERPPIPGILIEATMRAIKAGMKVDEFAKAIANDQEKQNAALQKGVKIIKKKTLPQDRRRRPGAGGRNKSTDEDEHEHEPERTYRNFDERRMGFLLIGDQHRFAGTGAAGAGTTGTGAAGGKGSGGKEQASVSLIFPSAAPLDFSFCMINRIEEIVTEGEQPQTTRNFRQPLKTPDDRYRTSSIRLSYNVIDTMEGLVNVLYKILDGGPFGLCWLDMSFNTIAKLDEDTLVQLPNIKIFYLHGNAISDMTEIPKLQVLKNMRTFTLHGNPIEEEEGYRIGVLYYLPDLIQLDFVAVTKSDKANSKEFGAKLEPYWAKRHEEFEANYISRKKAAETTYTEKVMRGELGSDDENDD